MTPSSAPVQTQAEESLLFRPCHSRWDDLAGPADKEPSKRKGREPDIDEDGIHNWFVDDEVPEHITDWGKALRHGAVANVLNLKRVLRQQIEPKLDELLGRLERIEKTLGEVERKIQ